MFFSIMTANRLFLRERVPRNKISSGKMISRIAAVHIPRRKIERHVNRARKNAVVNWRNEHRSRARGNADKKVESRRKYIRSRDRAGGAPIDIYHNRYYPFPIKARRKGISFLRFSCFLAFPFLFVFLSLLLFVALPLSTEIFHGDCRVAGCENSIRRSEGGMSMQSLGASSRQNFRQLQTR